MTSISSGNFTFSSTPINDLVAIEVVAYGDSRGSFMETYKESDFKKGGVSAVFVQDNQSSSIKGTLRGLHYQIEYPQAKLVRVIKGEVFDVAVDLRKESSSYGKWFGTVLSEQNGRQLYIPRGCAHGFLVLSEKAEFCYKCDNEYRSDDEGGLLWNDPEIGIRWPLVDSPLILSEKDKVQPSFSELK